MERVKNVLMRNTKHQFLFLNFDKKDWTWKGSFSSYKLNESRREVDQQTCSSFKVHLHDNGIQSCIKCSQKRNHFSIDLEMKISGRKRELDTGQSKVRML